VWVGLWLIGHEAISIGTLVLFILLMRNWFKPTLKIIKEWNTVGRVYASVERIAELFDRVPTVSDAPDAEEAAPFAGHVAFRDVTFAYRSEDGTPSGGTADDGSARPALAGVSFGVEPGKVLALVGHSGAGKSTVAQLIPRLYDPDDGAVLIDGHDIRRYTLASLRAQISVVLQDTVLFSGSVADNIAYGQKDATREQIITAARQANAHEFIERLPEGYDTWLGERGSNLSGGQRQRIAIARAIIRSTPVLILDEPTTGLDTEATQLVLAALRTLMAGKTTIIISHDLNLIRTADEILVVADGRIVQRGVHQTLLEAGGSYADLYYRRFDGTEANGHVRLRERADEIGGFYEFTAGDGRRDSGAS
jgi:ABC-type multidrug transport system fused ATPase/permease subunit